MKSICIHGLTFELHCEKSVPPTIESEKSGIWNLYSPIDHKLTPLERSITINLTVSVRVPDNHIAFLKSQPGAERFFQVSVKSTVVESEYRSCLRATLVNDGLRDFKFVA